MKDINVSDHLSNKDRINMGSFYTPEKYVDLVAYWLIEEDISDNSVFADLTCGGGAFFKLHDRFPNNRFIGNDIDEQALETAKTYFPFVHYMSKNAFCHVSRKEFEIPETDKFIIIGNPPWNDSTSMTNKSIKKDLFCIDADIKTRDLGMSALLSYDKLEADYVAVLHPLSYLIKPANFKLCEKFFKNYELKRHIIFNSQEFANTSQIRGFPVIVALYKRNPGKGLSYKAVKDMRFQTVEGQTFSLSDRDYISDLIDKYPTPKRYNPEILFFTQRDINALKRCQTFMRCRTNASVDVDPSKLAYYCYLDCFKRFADVPYFLGNFNVPFFKADFDSIRNEVICISKFYNQDIFGVGQEPSREALDRVNNYIRRVLTFI